MLKALKKILKNFLPPSIRIFIREIEVVLSEIRKISVQIKKEEDRQCQNFEKGISLLENSIRISSESIDKLEKISKENVLLHQMILEQSKLIEDLQQQLQHQRYSTENIIKKIELEKRELTYQYYRRLPQEKYEQELTFWYQDKMGKVLDLSSPKTYSEKIQWLKLYDNTPLKTQLADKYLVRNWVKERIGEEYLIPLLGVWDSFDKIDFKKLPDRFVLKATHGCGWNIIVSDKTKFNIDDAKKKFKIWLGTNYAFKVGFELQYKNILPRIIAEEYLENNNDDLYDYKVFCFAGKAESIMFLSERKKKLKMAFYDLNWNKLPFTYNYPINEAEVPKPKNFDLLIELAERLASGFSHVRVDFYVLNDGSIKFGEMTFTSASGTCNWNPPEQDLIYGDLIQLPIQQPCLEN